ncbi:hypothetical protein DespoDRAFT_01321 [Desulfobacter postgatei 2ac9]|jgi:hypothetical protein|uniref:Uncharacterized protein n=1 Tax=Desulfobacter postgatei 2ac9 TaxID=879212 RepID=I5B1B5_9BACT|nr:hypothetical protein DespoDRAFT_01321 [Desulfobacter postgatei 2ac9]
MLRLCSDSSRSYPGRSVLHALSTFCNNSRLGPYRETKVQASPAVADGDETRTIGSTCKRRFIAPFRVTCLVTEQKSADVIVAKRRE